MTVARPKNHFSLISGTRKRFRSVVLKALVVLFAVALRTGANEFAAAQDIFGRIVGTVTDPSGASVANANVAITNADCPHRYGGQGWILRRRRIARRHLYGDRQAIRFQAHHKNWERSGGWWPSDSGLESGSRLGDGNSNCNCDRRYRK